MSSQQNQYEGSRDNLKSARASAGVATQQQENAVDTYQEQIEKGTLKAGISGTVTAINVKQGDTYAGGVIATIQDCSAFVVSAEIDEYDIADVKLGMKAVFKTDATRDEQLQGEVIFISPTPTQGSNVTYQVKVKINSPTDRLRLGMNAKLNIILRETADVLTVPYDAVQQDENGNDVAFHFVTTLEHEGKTYVYLQGDDENDEDDAMVIEIFELESEEDGDEAYDRLYPVDDDLYEVLYNKLLEEVQKQAELGDEDACEGCEEESCEGCPLDDGKAE